MTRTRKLPNIAPDRAIVGKLYTIHHSGRHELRAKWLGLSNPGSRWERARLEVKGQIRILPTSKIDRMTRREEA